MTGGAGFIGANLCARLVAEGNEVVCLDNLSSGLRSNVAALEENSAFRFVEHDVCEPYRAEVDAIYHLACPASPPFYQADPIQTARTCFLRGNRSASTRAGRTPRSSGRSCLRSPRTL